MNKIEFLEFKKLTVINTDKNSLKYLQKTIKGSKIYSGSSAFIGNEEFDIDSIIQEGVNKYRLINSNSTLIVELE